MKKKISILIISLLLIIPLKVNAASVSVSLSCPGSAKVSEVVSCTVKATPSGSDIKGIQANYNISNGTYNSFSLGSGWTAYSNSASGISLGRNSGASSTVIVGTLKVKMPSSGTMKVTLTNVQGSDSSYATLIGNSPSASIRVKSTVNTLKTLSLSNGTLSPTFSAGTTSYKATINASSTVISATKTDSLSTISGTGTKKLAYGTNSFTITVTSEAGTKKTYTITITRPDNRSTNNNLGGLSISSGTLSPAFSAGTTSYSVNVAETINSIKINASVKDTKASFVSGYGPRTVNLGYGNNKILIQVRAENESVKTYTITVNRKDNRSSNTTLSELKVSVGSINFNSSIREYNMTVPYTVETISTTAVATDSKSKVEIKGGEKLKVGENKIIIKVTAENTTSKEYIITVIRQEEGAIILNSDSTLSSIKINGEVVELKNGVFTYPIKLKKEMENIEIDAKTKETTSSVEIIGNSDIIDGSIINIKVTAEDKSTTTYTISCSIEENNTVTYILVVIGTTLIVESVNIILYVTILKKKKNQIE